MFKMFIYCLPGTVYCGVSLCVQSTAQAEQVHSIDYITSCSGKMFSSVFCGEL